MHWFCGQHMPTSHPRRSLDGRPSDVVPFLRSNLMRITKLRTTPVAVPFRTDEIWAFGRRRGQASVLLELETDEGVTGLGEAATYPSTDIVLAVFRSLEPLVIGSDPFRIEQLLRRI